MTSPYVDPYRLKLWSQLGQRMNNQGVQIPFDRKIAPSLPDNNSPYGTPVNQDPPFPAKLINPHGAQWPAIQAEILRRLGGGAMQNYPIGGPDTAPGAP